jgi:hypothetical protein
MKVDTRFFGALGEAVGGHLRVDDLDDMDRSTEATRVVALSQGRAPTRLCSESELRSRA